MTQILLDADAANKLTGLKSTVELCDPSGRVLGRFEPIVGLSEWEAVADPISDEELERRLKSNEKSYSTEEVLAYLEKL